MARSISRPSPRSASDDSGGTFRDRHMAELFKEADERLHKIRHGNEVEALNAATELMETHEDPISKRMKERFHSNPMFQDLVDYMDAVVYGLKTEDKEALASEAAHYDSVLSASLKLMMREVTFSRNDIQRETSMSRVYEWFQEKLKVREQIRDRMGLPSNKVDNGEKNVSKVSRRERYESKHSERPYSAAATTRSRSTVRKTAENNSRIIGRGKNRLQRPSTAPFSTQGNDPDDDVKLTGRLQTGGFRMRNLFASQRKRILKSTTMKRAEQRRMIGQITDAAEAHAADVEESANMYSYLVGGTATTKKSMARPRTAGDSRARAKGSAGESKRVRPTTSSSNSIVQRSGSSRPNTNVYDYPYGRTKKQIMRK